MCGRAKMEGDFSKLRVPFRLAPEHPLPNFLSTWNLAPTDPVPIVRRDPGDKLRRLDIVRWGLLPFWAKDAKLSYSTFNARGEEVDSKPAFRDAFKARRCLWCLTPDRPEGKASPYAVALADGSRWRWPDFGLCGGRPSQGWQASAASFPGQYAGRGRRGRNHHWSHSRA
jgi:putative SOS response-associated peptidase YedK